MITLEIALFYFVASLLGFAAFLHVTNRTVFSMVLSILTVFISSEFWEIPIFLMAYLGVPGFPFPNFVHHLLIIFMFYELLMLIDFQVNWFSVLLPLGVVVFNGVFQLRVHGVISPWILRGLTVAVLFAVSLRRLKVNG